MGQQASSEPLGYVYQPSNMSCTSIKQSKQRDFVLNNPELYGLQSLCERCNPKRLDDRCLTCQRAPLIENDLAEDLEYIDDLYYSDLAHYTSAAEQSKRKRPELIKSQVSLAKERQRKLIRSAHSIDLSYKSLAELSPAIAKFNHLTSLILSNNQITMIPEEVGYLKGLVLFDVSNNKISQLPDSLCLLSKLKELNASQNRLEALSPAIGQLSELRRLIVSKNQITLLPRELSRLSKLISLCVSDNPLRVLPAEILTLGALTKLFTDGCDFEQEYSYSLQHDPPSLLETCARLIVRDQLDIPKNLTGHLRAYLSSAHDCSYCHGPYFDSFVTRYRLAERGTVLALEHTLCCAHWSDEHDRLLNLFSECPYIRTNTRDIAQRRSRFVHKREMPEGSEERHNSIEQPSRLFNKYDI